MHICAGPGASCVPVHPCRALPWIGSRTTGNGWFLEKQTGLPEQLRTDSKSAGLPGDGVSTPQEVPLETARWPPDWTLLGCGWHEATSDASESSGGGDGWVATCDGNANHIAFWYTQRSLCCPYGQECPCLESALWGGSGPGVLLETRGNWYANAVGDPPIHLTLRAHCTWLPSQWPRHPWVTQHAWIPAPGTLLSEGTRDLSRGWCVSWVMRAFWLTESNSMPRKSSSEFAWICSFPNWPENPTGWGAWKGGACTDIPEPRTRIAGMPCAAGGLRHESTHPSGWLLQTNLEDGCTRKCISASTSWTAACEVHGSKLANPRLTVTHHSTWAQWSKAWKTLTSYRLERPALLHPSLAGLRFLHARQGY